jgi:hypothetical protein
MIIIISIIMLFGRYLLIPATNVCLDSEQEKAARARVEARRLALDIATMCKTFDSSLRCQSMLTTCL